MNDKRSVRQPPTREIFYPATAGTDPQQSGTHTGYLINADDETAVIECYVPWDFHELMEMKVVMIAAVTLAPMTIRITTNYAAKNEVMNRNVQGPFEKSINTGQNQLLELDISEFVRAGVGVSGVERGDYIGVAVDRILGQNTNALILGVRFKYKRFLIE